MNRVSVPRAPGANVEVRNASLETLFGLMRSILRLSEITSWTPGCSRKAFENERFA